MKLSEKIMTLRKRAGWSQEELSMRLDVSRQAVSKWEAEQSVPDLDKILGMSELFGVSTDSLLKDTEPLPDGSTYVVERAAGYGTGTSDPTDPGNIVRNTAPDGNASSDFRSATADGRGSDSRNNDISSGAAPREVTGAETDAFLAVKEKSAARTALGALLCVLSPICLITLALFADEGRISENFAVAVGLAVVLVFVSVAVALFLTSHAMEGKFDWAEHPFVLREGIGESVGEKRDAYRNRHTLMQIVGTLLCILAIIPLIVSSLIFEGNMYTIFGLDVLLLLVSVGVYCFIRTGGRWNAYRTLLGEDRSERRGNVLRSAVSAIYWPLVTAGFLAYSFITSDWGRSWIIWAVAGVLYGAVAAIAESVSRSRETRECR